MLESREKLFKIAPPSRANFVFLVPGLDQECTQRPKVTKPGQVPLCISCSSAVPAFPDSGKNREEKAEGSEEPRDK